MNSLILSRYLFMNYFVKTLFCPVKDDLHVFGNLIILEHVCESYYYY